MKLQGKKMAIASAVLGVALSVGVGAIPGLVTSAGASTAASTIPSGASTQLLGDVGSPSTYQVTAVAATYVVEYRYNGAATLNTVVDGKRLGRVEGNWVPGNIDLTVVSTVRTGSFSLSQGRHTILSYFPEGFGTVTAYLVRV